MTDNKDESGKGSSRPGDAPRRPHATLDLRATEVGSSEAGAEAAASAAGKPGDSTPAQTSAGASEDDPRHSSLAGRIAAASRWLREALTSGRLLSHAVAGVAGAALTLAVSALLGLFSAGGGSSADVTKRMAELEQAIRQRASMQSNDTAKLAQAESRLKDLEQQTRTLAALSDTQAKLAASIKSLEARSPTSDYANRLAKIETTVAALSANDRSGHAGALAEKLTALERQVGEAMDVARSGAERTERDLAAAKAEVSSLAKRLETLRAETDQRLKTTAGAADLGSVAAKLTGFERDLQAFLKGEGERASNATRVLLALEIANLKRAMDRGQRYSAEIDAVRRLAGKTINLAPLERYSLEGAPALAALAKDFRRVADTALDAEAEPSDGSVVDRLMSGARSIVRIRKTGHSAEDTSTEAVLGRMEAALKEGSLAEVLEQGKKLPPKAALAAEEWLKKVEARYTADRALADVELALKTSLAAGTAAEPKR